MVRGLAVTPAGTAKGTLHVASACGLGFHEEVSPRSLTAGKVANPQLQLPHPGIRCHIHTEATLAMGGAQPKEHGRNAEPVPFLGDIGL